MKETIEIVVEENSLDRIDKYLTTKTDLSRTRIQELIDSNNILVNDNPTKANYKVKENDLITVMIPEDEA